MPDDDTLQGQCRESIITTMHLNLVNIYTPNNAMTAGILGEVLKYISMYIVYMFSEILECLSIKCLMVWSEQRLTRGNEQCNGIDIVKVLKQDHTQNKFPLSQYVLSQYVEYTKRIIFTAFDVLCSELVMNQWILLMQGSCCEYAPQMRDDVTL